MNSKININLINALQGIKNNLSEQIGTAINPVKLQSKAPESREVMFDKSTAPFNVVFSKRGFLIDGTRFSFEEVETAISKNYNIVLNGGKGLTLDAIKMQKILKYKDIVKGWFL